MTHFLTFLLTVNLWRIYPAFHLPSAREDRGKYRFILKDGGSIVSAIASDYKQGDLLYAFMGDPQYWYPCAVNNKECLAWSACNGRTDAKCMERQNEWSNDVQKISIEALNALIKTEIKKDRTGLNGLIINGDLTDFGHKDEFERYVRKWSRVDGVPVYPGLGNHDYANNVDDCAMQNCANRMLEYMEYFVRHSNVNFDLVKTEKMFGVKKEYQGSLGYSWTDCDGESNEPHQNCVHFVQLQNYPTYTKSIDVLWPMNEWEVESSVPWLLKDLKSVQAGIPVVINFHQYEDEFGKEEQRLFYDSLEKSGVHVTGIFFAHHHAAVGVTKPYSCVNGKWVPLVYSGSVPAGNWVLVHMRGGRKLAYYQFHVEDERSTRVEKLHFIEGDC